MYDDVCMCVYIYDTWMCGFNLSQNIGRLARMNHPHWPAAKPRCHQWNLQNLKSHRWTFLAIQCEEIPPERCTPPPFMHHAIAELTIAVNWLMIFPMDVSTGDQDVEPLNNFTEKHLKLWYVHYVHVFHVLKLMIKKFSDFWTTHSPNKITIFFFYHQIYGFVGWRWCEDAAARVCVAFPPCDMLDTCSDMLRSLLIAKGLYFFKISMIFLQMYATFGNLSRLLSGPHVISRTQGNE